MHIDIRELALEDLDKMILLRLELLEKHPLNFGSSVEEEQAFDKEKWIKRLTNPNTRTIGVFDLDALIGLGVLALNPRKKMKHIGVLNSFYIKKAYRNKGLAKRLFAFIETRAIKEGIKRINLSVMEENLHAKAFYAKEGFEETGKELDTIYLGNKYYSLTLMSKKLID